MSSVCTFMIIEVWNLIPDIFNFVLSTSSRSGRSLTFFTRDDWKYANELIAILEEAGQVPPTSIHSVILSLLQGDSISLCVPSAYVCTYVLLAYIWHLYMYTRLMSPVYVHQVYVTCTCTPGPCHLYMYTRSMSPVHVHQVHVTCICTPGLRHLYMYTRSMSPVHVHQVYVTCTCTPGLCHLYMYTRSMSPVHIHQALNISQSISVSIDAIVYIRIRTPRSVLLKLNWIHSSSILIPIC